MQKKRPRPQQPQPKKKWFRIFFLHRYAGLIAAFFTLVLSVTGILLNHTEELELHKHNASSPWLLALYGIKAPDIKAVYRVISAENDTWIVEFGGEIYLRDKPIDCKPPLTGAVTTNELIIISNSTQLCLFTLEGELIDYLSSGKNNSISRLGKNHEGRAIADTTLGWYTLNTDYTELVTTPKNAKPHINWQTSASLPSALTASLVKSYKGKGLPWERVILDLHSGRIIGLAGVFFMDFIALLMIFLAITGVIMWSKRRGGRNGKRKSRPL